MTEPESGRRRGGALLVVGIVLLAGAVAGLVLAVRVHHSTDTVGTPAASSRPQPVPRLTCRAGHHVNCTLTTPAPAFAPATAEPTPAEPTPSAPAPVPAAAGPLQVLTAYYDAINAKDWRKVWKLGGKNLDSSYRAMVQGYAHTAHDVPYITGLSATDADVTLLAFEDSGLAQLYTGTLVIAHGEIVRAHQTLAYADDNDGFDLLAGQWSGHDRDLELTPGGLGVMSFRTFNDCGRLSNGCDETVGNQILNGGLIVFQLTDGQGDEAVGHVRSSSVRTAGQVRMTRDPSNDTLSFNLLKDAPFCRSDSPAGRCGA